LKGAQAAVAAGAHKITLPFSASDTHLLKNVRRTPEQMLEETRGIVALLRSQPADRRPRFEAGISTAFGCSYEGAIPEDKVVRLAETVVESGCDEVGLSDSTGYANPAQVKSLVRRVRGAIGESAFAGLHLHNTRGLGLANVMAGLEMGVKTFDSSLAGLGGCPWAPGASGNIVTEDLVFMLEAMGLRTGIDLDRLLAVRNILASSLPEEALYGFVPQAGLPLGFTPTL
ncbi:MAG: hydroxymethylglutaryl-CoA lyase, partial [Gammaproteobacteria bacterium]|nr:hydroxymethylglutaryl-CoA lyase [Gammaproteobacteria bacterium]